MSSYIRSLSLLADDDPVGAGCRLTLSGSAELSLLPSPFLLRLYDPAPAAVSRLRLARRISVLSGASLLAWGEPVSLRERTVSGRSFAEVLFAPGLSLWEKPVSLSLAAGLRVSETLRALLRPADIPLAAFRAPDPILSRPQSFFGRLCDALSLLAETAGADIWLAPAGVCVSSSPGESFSLSLLSAPSPVEDRLILSVPMMGWPLGAGVSASWQGAPVRGRILSRRVDADNASGPWLCELEILPPP